MRTGRRSNSIFWLIFRVPVSSSIFFLWRQTLMATLTLFSNKSLIQTIQNLISSLSLFLQILEHLIMHERELLKLKFTRLLAREERK